LSRGKNERRDALKTFFNGSRLEEKERDETSKFLDTESNNEMTEKAINNMNLIDMEEWRRKTKRCENIDNLYINK
jgi:hypothetical protein